MTRNLGTALLFLVSISSSFCANGCSESRTANHDEGRAKSLEEIQIRVGDVPVVAEVALAPAKRRAGLMHRDGLRKGHGMLFVFPVVDNLAFYMKNTRFDLDLGYFDAGGVLFQVERMKAYDRRAVYSRKPALYALEVPAGFFAAGGIKIGDKLALPAKIKGQ